MKVQLKRYTYIALGWFFIALAAVGVILPLLPTTPFLLVALALFSRSSPRFHQMLLDNRWFGPILAQWENNKTIARATKYKATAVIVVCFSLSIAMLSHRIILQLMLIAIAVVCLSCIWRIKES